MPTSSFPIPINSSIPSTVKPKPSVQSALPVFSHQQVPAVYIANSRFDAQLFRYVTPLTMLGLAGYIVDYGDKLGYFPSTWQGQSNSSQVFQDLQTLIQLARHRVRKVNNYNQLQLGKWAKKWLIAGEATPLVDMLKKLVDTV